MSFLFEKEIYYDYLLLYNLNENGKLKIKNVIVLFFFIEFLFKDRGSTFSNHGILNLYGFFIILFFGEVLILIILIYIHLIKGIKYKLIALLIGLFFIFIFSYKLNDKYHCKNWDLGLNNTYIDNNSTNYPCKIYIPRYKCYIDILGKYLDFSIFINCNKRKKNEKYLLLHDSNLKNESNIKRIGYPITIKYKIGFFSNSWEKQKKPLQE